MAKFIFFVMLGILVPVHFWGVSLAALKRAYQNRSFSKRTASPSLEKTCGILVPVRFGIWVPPSWLDLSVERRLFSGVKLFEACSLWENLVSLWPAILRFAATWWR